MQVQEFSDLVGWFKTNVFEDSAIDYKAIFKAPRRDRDQEDALTLLEFIIGIDGQNI